MCVSSRRKGGAKFVPKGNYSRSLDRILSAKLINLHVCFSSFRLRFAESSKFLGKCGSFDRFTEPRGANDVRKSVTSGQAGFCFSIGNRESHSFSRCGNYMYLF